MEPCTNAGPYAVGQLTPGPDGRPARLCPGATDTPFFDVAGDNASVGSQRTPQQVVNTALAALGGRKATVVDGTGNALVSRVVSRLAPERPLIRIAERSVRPSA